MVSMDLVTVGKLLELLQQKVFWNDLGMFSVLGNVAFYIKLEANGVKGITGCYLDDKFYADDKDFELETE